MNFRKLSVLPLAACLCHFAWAENRDLEIIVQEPFYVPEDRQPVRDEYPKHFMVSDDETLLLTGSRLHTYVYDLGTGRLLRHLWLPPSLHFGDAILDPTSRFVLAYTETYPSYLPNPMLFDLESGGRKALGIIESSPLRGSTRELRREDPWSIVMSDDSAMFRREQTGQTRGLAVDFDSALPSHTAYHLPKRYRLSSGHIISWYGGDWCESLDNNGNVVRFSLIPDPGLRVLKHAALRKDENGRPILFGFDRNMIFAIDARKDQLISKIPSTEHFRVDSYGRRALLLQPSGSVVVVDVETGATLRVIAHHEKPAEYVGNQIDFAISGDGSSAAYWNPSDNSLWHHNLESNTAKRLSRQEAHLRLMDYSFDGSKLVVSGLPAVLNESGNNAIIDTITGEIIRIPKAGLAIIDSTGQYVAYQLWAGRFGGQFGVFETTTQKQHVYPSFSVRDTTPTGVCFTPDSKNLLIANGLDGMLSIDLTNLTEEQEPKTVLPGVFQEGLTFIGSQGVLQSFSGELLMFDWEGTKAIERLRIYPLNNGRFVAVTPERRYFGKPESLQVLAFRSGRRALPIDQFDLQLNRPDIIQDILGARSRELTLFREAVSRRHRLEMYKPGQLSSEANPPSLRITNQDRIPSATTNRELQIEVDLSAGSGTLDRLLAFVNGVPVNNLKPIDQERDTLLQTLIIPLSQGSNEIQLSCRNTFGKESIRETLRVFLDDPTFDQASLYVLAVGVSQYKLKAMNLAVAAKDAEDFCERIRETCETQFSSINTKILTDQNATKQAILESHEFLASSQADDRIILFMAGHGFQDSDYNYWFGTHDIDPEAPQDKGVSYSVLEALFEHVKARERLILLDTCYAGRVDKETLSLAANGKHTNIRGIKVVTSQLARETGPSPRQETIELEEELFAHFQKRTGATVLTASSGVEYVFAEERDSIGNGVFTHALMHGLTHASADANGDGQLGIYEWKNHAFDLVRHLTGNRQRPSLRQLNYAANLNVTLRTQERFQERIPQFWVVKESVSQEHGGWRIQWKMQFQKEDGNWRASGSKVFVNEKPANQWELNTRLDLDLEIKELAATGSSLEVSSKGGEILGSVVLHFSPDFDQFSGYLFDENDRIVSNLYGTAE